MKTFPNSIDRHRKALEIAVRYEAVPMMLETLVRVAELLHYDGEKQRPLEIVALALRYPLSPRVRVRAETLALDIAKDTDVAVIQQVQRWTDQITLDEMVEAILAV